LPYIGLVSNHHAVDQLSDGSNAGFMLNTDFELFYNLTLDSNAKATCNLNSVCGLSTPGIKFMNY
jgi:hypothetical protein